jgi:hypothetical protein
VPATFPSRGMRANRCSPSLEQAKPPNLSKRTPAVKYPAREESAPAAPRKTASRVSHRRLDTSASANRSPFEVLVLLNSLTHIGHTREPATATGYLKDLGRRLQTWLPADDAASALSFPPAPLVVDALRLLRDELDELLRSPAMGSSRGSHDRPEQGGSP